MGSTWNRLAILDIDQSVIYDLEASDWIGFRVNIGITRLARLPSTLDAIAELRNLLESDTTPLSISVSYCVFGKFARIWEAET